MSNQLTKEEIQKKIEVLEFRQKAISEIRITNPILASLVKSQDYELQDITRRIKVLKSQLNNIKQY